MGGIEISKINNIHIYAINDFHGAVESLLWEYESKEEVLCNHGIKLFSFLLEKKEEKTNKIILSIGDMFQLQKENKNKFAGLTFELMREVKFDCMSIGNHEFDWNADNEKYFEELSTKIKTPLVCCNLFFENSENKPRGLVKSKIINISNIKLGLIGVVTPQCKQLCTAEELGNYVIKDTEKSINEEVIKLKSLGVNFIILLAHMDIYYNDKSILEGELVELIKKIDLKDIKLILTGHSHQIIKDKICEVPILQAGANGEAITYVNISVDEDKKDIEVKNTEIINVSDLEVTKIHPTIKNISLEYIKDNYIEKSLIGNIPENVKSFENREYGWMKYIIESIREFALADIAMINYKFFRKPILGDRVYDKDILDYIPFKNFLFSMTIEGSKLLEIYKSYETKSLRGGLFIGIQAKQIDISKEYLFATTDFLAQGGDSFILLKEGKNRIKHNITIQDIVLNKLIDENWQIK